MEKLYALIPQEKLSERLLALSRCLGISVQLLNEAGDPLEQHGCTAAYCELLHKKVFTHHECEQIHLQAGRIAYALGESYIFGCHADLNHIAFPLVSRKQLLGTVIIGPFLMDHPDSTLITSLSEKQNLQPALCLELYDELQSLPIIDPQRVNQISQLTGFLFAPLLTDERLLMLERQEKLYQQSRINETIQKYKEMEIESSSDYWYQKENDLLGKVKNCEIHQAKALLNELLGYVLFVEGNNLDLIKSHALELTTLLSRVAIEGGALSNRIMGLTPQFLDQILKSESYEEICFTLQEIVESFVQSITMTATSRLKPAIRKAIDYIAEHFNEPLSIQSLAAELQISPTYFSALFSKQMGIGFQEHLTRVRIEEAKTLLTSTDYPISQIALSVGYADQSSLTKAFKRITGITPYQLR